MESPSVKDSYSVGDRVFAERIGFPHWPAQIIEKFEGASDEFCVVYFGVSSEIAYVKSGSMCHYTEAKANKFSLAELKRMNSGSAAQYKRALEECALNVTFVIVDVEENGQMNLGDISSGSLQGQAIGKPVPGSDFQEAPGSSGGENRHSCDSGGQTNKPKSFSIITIEEIPQGSVNSTRASLPKPKTASMELAVAPSGLQKRKSSLDESSKEEEPVKKTALEKNDESSGSEDSSDEPQILYIQPRRADMFLTHCTQTQVPAQLPCKEETLMPSQEQLISSAPSTPQQHPLPKSWDAIPRVVVGGSAKNSRGAKVKVFAGPSTTRLPAVAASVAVNKQVNQASQEGPMESPRPVKELNGSEEVTNSEMQPGPSRESIRKKPDTITRTPRRVSSRSKSDSASANKKAQVETPNKLTFGATKTKIIHPDEDSRKIVTGSTVAVGDRVFAKVVGFPYWPAQVTEKSSEDDFKVVFYGTHQTGFVKSNALCPYNQENTEKHSSAMSKKKRAFRIKFRKALVECDSNVSLLGNDLGSMGGKGLPGTPISVLPAVVSKANPMGGDSNGEEVHQSETVDDDSDVEIPIVITSVKSLSEKVGSSTPKTEGKEQMEINASEDGRVYRRSGRKIKPTTSMNAHLESALNSSLFSPVKTSKEEVIKSEVSTRGDNKRTVSFDGEKEVSTESKEVGINKDSSTKISIPTTRKSGSRSASGKVTDNKDAVTSDKPEIVYVKPSTAIIKRFLSNESPSPASQPFGWKQEIEKPMEYKVISSAPEIRQLVVSKFMGAIEKVMAGVSSKISKSASREISVGTSTTKLSLLAHKSQAIEFPTRELDPKVPQVVDVEDKNEVFGEPQLKNVDAATSEVDWKPSAVVKEVVSQQKEIATVTKVVSEEERLPRGSHNQQGEVQTETGVTVSEEKKHELRSVNQQGEVEKVIQVLVSEDTHKVQSEAEKLEERVVKASKKSLQEEELPGQNVGRSEKASVEELPEEMEVPVADTQTIQVFPKTEASEDILMQTESELPKGVMKGSADAEGNVASKKRNGVSTGAAGKQKVDAVVKHNTTPRASAATNMKTPLSATKRARAESPKKSETSYSPYKKYSLISDSAPKSTVSSKKIESITGKAIKSSTSTTDRKESSAAAVNAIPETNNEVPSNGAVPEENSESEPYETTEADFPDEANSKGLTKVKDVMKALFKLFRAALNKESSLDVTLTKVSNPGFVDESLLKSHPVIANVVKKVADNVNELQTVRLKRTQKAKFYEMTLAFRETDILAECLDEIMATNTDLRVSPILEEMERKLNET